MSLKIVILENDMHQRVNRYREESKAEDNEDKQNFRDAVADGEFKDKCIKCYDAGGRWCKYWETGFECEEIEEGEVADLLKKFIKRERK